MDNLAGQLIMPALNIYPNPASGEINLSILTESKDQATYKVTFSSAIGTIVKEFSLSQTGWQGNVGNLLPGTYLVRVVDNKTNGLVLQGKFVKLLIYTINEDLTTY